MVAVSLALVSGGCASPSQGPVESRHATNRPTAVQSSIDDAFRAAHPGGVLPPGLRRADGVRLRV